MSTFHSQVPSGHAVGRLLRSAWRYKGLIAAAVLLGALVGYGWTARQPTLYEGAAQVAIDPCPLPASCPIGTSGADRVDRAQELMTSPAVLDRAVTLSGSRVSAEKLAQHLKVEALQDTNVITIRVVDPTAKGAAQLANAVAAASKRIVPSLVVRAAVPEQAIQSSPVRPMGIGMLFGLLVSVVLVWWRTRRQGPTPRSSAPELPSPA